MDKRCEICERELTGKQRRFCSTRCRNIAAGSLPHPKLKPPSREWLAAEYLLPPEGKGRTQPDISAELGVSDATLRKWINQYGLKQSGRDRLKHFATMPKYETPSREWLLERYIEKDMSIREIADEVGSSIAPVVGWLKRYKIIKSPKQIAGTHSKRMSGERNPAYLNGNSQKYVRRKLAEVKPKVCNWCGTTARVQVHHIDHNRENNDESNLTWLCGTCNRIEADVYTLKQSGRAEVSFEGNILIVTFVAKAT